MNFECLRGYSGGYRSDDEKGYQSYFNGEGINDPKGIFGTTINLSKKYGEKRAIESLISENGITGIAIGLGINNFKVLLIHQRVEFALLSIEQIFNNAKEFLCNKWTTQCSDCNKMVMEEGGARDLLIRKVWKQFFHTFQD